MNTTQKFTPKYWVGHNKTTDDVFPSTLAKGYSVAELLMEGEFGGKYWEDEDLEIILVEIKMVEQK